MSFLSHLLYKFDYVIIAACPKSAFDVAIDDIGVFLRIRLHISNFFLFT